MDVSTITMDPDTAREKLREYRRHRHHAVDAEYQRAAIAYEQLAKGTPLLVLSGVMRAAPRDEHQRPRLAIARADRKQVYYCRFATPRAHSFDTSRGGPPSDTLTVQVPIAADETWGNHHGGYALVPMVPPAVLGNRGLGSHFILWEVERWADVRIGAAPDRDPFLLRFVADDLYAIVGEWELTDVERAVMRDRRDR